MPLTCNPAPEDSVPPMWHAFNHRGVVLQRRPIGWCTIDFRHRRARTKFAENDLTKAEARRAYDRWMGLEAGPVADTEAKLDRLARQYGANRSPTGRAPSQPEMQNLWPTAPQWGGPSPDVDFKGIEERAMAQLAKIREEAVPPDSDMLAHVGADAVVEAVRSRLRALVQKHGAGVVYGQAPNLDMRCRTLAYHAISAAKEG